MSKQTSPVPIDNSEDNNDSESSSATGDDTSDAPAVESLVTGRAKRVTAGNRLSSLLDKEGDEELELLFAENEEDVEFEEDDDEAQASDAELDSSTDEEEHNRDKADDELAGEKELQKQDRLERQKKRKAQQVFRKPAALRKKVKIDASATPAPPAPRPKKKSERVSWIHTEADAPTRASSRKQTVQNREVVHRRLVESEQTRLKVMQHMEEAQKRKDAAKAKVLTQADRMEEAAKTERRNAKSLNRWEESEKQRAEDQRAKLEALHNRQLTGPVIAWWSGLARWVNGRLMQLGVKEIRKEGFTEKPTGNDKKVPDSRLQPVHDNPSKTVQDLHTDVPEVLHPHQLTEPFGQMTMPMNHTAPLAQQFTFATPQSPYGFLDGIHAYAAMPLQGPRAEFTGTADGGLHPHNHSRSVPYGQYNPEPPAPRPSSLLAPEIEFASRTLVALKEIDANALKLPQLQSSVLLKKSRAKIQSRIPSYHGR